MFPSRRSPVFFLLCSLILCGLAWPRSAFAYIDPGTGSFLIQGVIAAVIGAGVAVKVFWRKIMSALTGRSYPDQTDDDE